MWVNRLSVYVCVFVCVEGVYVTCVLVIFICLKEKKKQHRDFPGGWDGKASAYNAGDQVQFLHQEDALEKEMAPHSSTLAWKIPWTENPGRLQSWGRKESDTTEWLHFTSQEK